MQPSFNGTSSIFLIPLIAHSNSPWSPYAIPPYALWWVRLMLSRSTRKQLTDGTPTDSLSVDGGEENLSN